MGFIGVYPLVMTNIAMDNHHCYWEIPLFLWSFSIAMLANWTITMLWKWEIPLFRLGHGFNSYVTNYQRVTWEFDSQKWLFWSYTTWLPWLLPEELGFSQRTYVHLCVCVYIYIYNENCDLCQQTSLSGNLESSLRACSNFKRPVWLVSFVMTFTPSKGINGISIINMGNPPQIHHKWGKSTINGKSTMNMGLERAFFLLHILPWWNPPEMGYPPLGSSAAGQIHGGRQRGGTGHWLSWPVSTPCHA